MMPRPAPRFGLPCWAVALLLLAPFAYALGFIFPRGDDFDEATRAMFLFDLPGGLYEIGREWLTWSGRYTYHFLAVFLGKAPLWRPVVALVCAGVLALYGLAGYGLAREAGVPSRRDAAFVGLCTVLVLLLCHHNLPAHYFQTDALTSGLNPALSLCFAWALCRLWRLWANGQDARKALRVTAGVGIVAVGVFEHSALAVLGLCVLATALALMHRAGRSVAVFVRLLLCCLGAVIFSFLAPGNFVRQATRQISPQVQWQQLSQAGQEWLVHAFRFFDNGWPLGVLLLLVLLAVASSRQDGHNRTISARPAAPLLALAAIGGYLGFSLAVAVLHAMSDVTLSRAAKLPASLALYAAIACGFALHGLLPGLRRMLCRCPGWLAIAPLLFLACSSPNLRHTLAHAANGDMLLLAHDLGQRHDLLKRTGLAATPADAPPKFGLMGEIHRPDARKRRIDPSLPAMTVPRCLPDVVYPALLGEPLPNKPEAWPNLWVAWLYGLGSVHSAAPTFPAAARLLPLDPPQERLDAPRAWLACDDGNGSPSAWLVLDSSTPLPEHIAVLRFASTDVRRLLPKALQNYWRRLLLTGRLVPSSFAARLVAGRLGFTSRQWQLPDGRTALPLGPADGLVPAVLLCLDGKTWWPLLGPAYRHDGANVLSAIHVRH